MEIKNADKVAQEFASRADLLALSIPGQMLAFTGLCALADVEMPIGAVKIYLCEVIPEIMRQNAQATPSAA